MNVKFNVASWADLIALYKTEEPFDLKNSKLTKASVYPNNVEKQKVSLVNNGFCERTVVALKFSSVSNSSLLDREDHGERGLALLKQSADKAVQMRQKGSECTV